MGIELAYILIAIISVIELVEIVILIKLSRENHKLECENILATADPIVVEILCGKWGSGQERKQKLTDAGYDYNEVQRLVNHTISKAYMSSLTSFDKARMKAQLSWANIKYKFFRKI